MASGLSIEIYSDWSQTASLRPEWQALHRGMGDGHPFTAYDWFSWWYAAYCPAGAARRASPKPSPPEPMAPHPSRLPPRDTVHAPAPTATAADSLATGVFVLPPGVGLRLIESLAGCACMLTDCKRRHIR